MRAGPGGLAVSGGTLWREFGFPARGLGGREADPAFWRYGASFFSKHALAFASRQVSVVLFAVLDAAK